ncbi:lytic polysaccharide monooxygenase [Streptomyces sp. IB201691-2A2]|uniref:lytic polysaccharide monooxygenase auxiliary activity family 9 protein n=1 Tax=Streptomyces sp. IB201691-2A2 TaxID=2561920 RepID=UPI00117DD69C|nr:lytic polysaccharide monooxygenase [Streptomyces sp. IB201691-2A2]TRO66186.1 LPXTG cell wall anchor domain-containing protein [Streptomyces sp. IB201691-2A2]
MSARRKATRTRLATVAAVGVAPLALTGLAATPAVAHGSMTDPVSRVAGCFAEGPENPRSAACKAAVAAGGTQALYDWNGVNIANAAGKSKEIIPDGKLCSAGNDKFKGLDLARADWPATRLTSGNRTFRYKGTAPHKGSFELYVTKDGYDPTKPLKWSDLESKPFLKVTDPRMESGDYVFNGVVPVKSGRHLVYSIWQRSDSPEAFYTCSDVVFGEGGGGGGGGAEASTAPTASAPSDQEIEDGTDESSVEHGGHGDDDPKTQATATAAADTASDSDAGSAASAAPSEAADDSASDAEPAGGSENLAETGGSSTTPYVAIGGAAALAIGAAALFASVRRRAASGRHSR